MHIPLTFVRLSILSLVMLQSIAWAQDDASRLKTLESKVETLEKVLNQLQAKNTRPSVEIISLRPVKTADMTEFVHIKNNTEATIHFGKDSWFFKNSKGEALDRELDLPPNQPAFVHSAKNFMADEGDVIRLMHKEEVVDKCKYPELPPGAVFSCKGTLSTYAARPAVVCINFKLFPDDTKMPSSFMLGGFDFHELGGGSTLFVNESGTGKGLQFPPAGLEVQLPASVQRVSFEVGTFAGSIDVAAFDSHGMLVSSKTIPGTNTYVRDGFIGHDIKSLVFTKGGHEGILSEICAELCNH